MPTGKSAAIIGGSLGGLFAANLLYRAGWDVRVYEKAARTLEARGAGIVTHPELLQSLFRAGVAAGANVGVRVRERITLDEKGNVVAKRRLPQTLTSWSRLYNLLYAALPPDRYHFGKRLDGISQNDRVAVASFEDGERLEVDVVIAADGIRSSARTLLTPSIVPRYAGYVAWRGLVEERELSDRARDEMFPFFSFGVHAHEQLVGYPVAGAGFSTAPGERRFNFVWYRPADEAALEALNTDAEGKLWRDGIPPPSIRSTFLAETRRAARQILAPQFAEAVEKAQSLFFQPIYDLESDRLSFGRVALLGDAAFVARPHVGMGVAKAADDAIALTDELARGNDVPSSLDRYSNSRTRIGSQIVERGRNLGANLRTGLQSVAERRMAERFGSVESVMRETAVYVRPDCTDLVQTGV